MPGPTDRRDGRAQTIGGARQTARTAGLAPRRSATIAGLGGQAAELHAWLGPAIGPDAFEVGAEVRDAYVARLPGSEACFTRNERGRYLADLYRLARLVLDAAGVGAVHGGGWCTHRDRDRFFSFRRDGVTGRMATLAWLA